MFRIGQKVVCVNNEVRPNRDWCGHQPIKGFVYTVWGFKESHFHGEEDCVLLAEMSNPIGYMPSRFRPIVERKTDIAIFKRMLLPASKERVDARP